MIYDDFGNIPWQQRMLISMFEYQIMLMKQFEQFFNGLIHPSPIHRTQYGSQDLISYRIPWKLKYWIMLGRPDQPCVK